MRTAAIRGVVLKVSVVLVVLLVLATGKSRAEDFLNLWIHPYLPATELVKRFNPLAGYLSEKVGVPVSVRVQKSYQSHIDRTGRDEVDISYLGPVSYVEIVGKYGRKPLLARLEVRGKPVFFGMIVVRKGSSIRSVGELAGRSFAFGDPNSTMSHLVPRYMLLEGGVPVDKLAKHEFLGSHHNVALGVLGGYFDAGGVKEEVFYEYEERGLRMLAKSPAIAEHVFVTRATLPEAMRESLLAAMMDLHKDDRAEDIFTSLKEGVSGLAPVADEDYDGLREILSRLGK